LFFTTSAPPRISYLQKPLAPVDLEFNSKVYPASNIGGVFTEGYPGVAGLEARSVQAHLPRSEALHKLELIDERIRQPQLIRRALTEMRDAVKATTTALTAA